MACTVTHDASIGIIEVVCNSHITAEEMVEAAHKRIALEKETGVNRTLIDVTNAQLSATTFDLLHLSQQHYKNLQASRRTRIAFVMPTAAEQHQAARFYETASRNRGWMVEVFSERQTAMDWLLSP
ncbi:MAG TPA: STAS/SEC14 domain-containing protein [Syntrophorhabdaceae bacterium]|nr:STAS/SEC14 domain-containing protein [Syntrophorhabdaceae bacterium]